MTDRIAERSTNYGRTWAQFAYHPRSPIAAVMEGLQPWQVYDDGVGNLYRWRPAGEP